PSTHAGAVVGTGFNRQHGSTYSRIVGAGVVVNKREITDSSIAGACRVGEECRITDAGVVRRVVMKKRECAIGCVAEATGVEQECPRASGRILVGRVQNERPSADTSVVVACYVALEGRPAKGGIESAAGEA